MAELRTLTSSRQQRVLLRLLSSSYGSEGWLLTPETFSHHCVEEGLSAPESVRLAEDVLAADVAMFRRDGGTLTPLGAAEATGEVRAHVETAELRARARELAAP